MGKALISVIVPIFNVETYIAECIESIQNQSYQELQIILVDDGSTDHSGILCDKYALEDSRIEVIHQENKGVVLARKSGLSKARGKYIGFVDGDDYIESDMYQILLEEIEKSKADFVHSGFWQGGKKEDKFPNREIKFGRDRYEFLKDVILKGYITPSNWSKLFRAELIKKAYDQLDDKSVLGEDLLILCICILECNKISLIKDCYYHYRVRVGSLSRKNEISDLKNVYKLHEDLNNVFCSYGLQEKCEAMMDEFLWNNLIEYMGRIDREGFQIAKYYFRDFDRLYGKRIVVYGAGAVGRDYYAQICRYSDCKVVAWVNAHPKKYKFNHIDLCGIDILNSIEFEILLIAVMKEKLADNIRDDLIERGIDSKIIYWSKPGRYGVT